MMFPPAVAFDFNTTTFGGSSSFVSRVSTKQFKRHGLLFNHIFDVSFFRFFCLFLGSSSKEKPACYELHSDWTEKIEIKIKEKRR